MAAATSKTKNFRPKVSAANLPECPVCLEALTAPILQCQSGHSLCGPCTQSLNSPICPMCRLPMTQMRNWQLEEMISKTKIPCPNQPAGCRRRHYVPTTKLQDHLKECILREMDCPLGVVFGKCAWKGQSKDIVSHFKDRHPAEYDVKPNTDILIKNINIDKDDRHFYLVSQDNNNIIFIITMMINTFQKSAFWAIQMIGSRHVAQQHIYEIQVTSQQDDRRKVIFNEHCYNDSVKADEVYRKGKCAILPLDFLSHFIKDKTLVFQFNIKRMPSNNKDIRDGNSDQNEPETNHKFNPNISRGVYRRGRGGPKGHFDNRPGFRNNRGGASQNT